MWGGKKTRNKIVLFCTFRLLIALVVEVRLAGTTSMKSASNSQRFEPLCVQPLVLVYRVSVVLYTVLVAAFYTLLAPTRYRRRWIDPYDAGIVSD